MSTSGRLALVAAAFLVLAIDPVLSTAPAGDGGPVSRRGTYTGGSYLIEVPAGWNGGLVIFAHGYGEASASPLASHLAANGYAWAASPTLGRVWKVSGAGGIAATYDTGYGAESLGYSDVDRAVVGRPDFEAAQLADFNECFRQGTRGACHDATLASGPWGFRPEEVGTPVYFWHGEADRVHSPQGARRLSMAIQRSRITFVPDAGAMVGLERTDENHSRFYFRFAAW